jgi:hypothetical protein
MPLTMNGSDAGMMTLSQVCSRFERLLRFWFFSIP